MICLYCLGKPVTLGAQFRVIIEATARSELGVDGHGLTSPDTYSDRDPKQKTK